MSSLDFPLPFPPPQNEEDWEEEFVGGVPQDRESLTSSW